MPLFLDPGWFVFVDLAPSYSAATADLADADARRPRRRLTPRLTRRSPAASTLPAWPTPPPSRCTTGPGWTAGDWHDFHLAWIAEIRKQLNGGVLPAGYSAKAEPQGGFRVREEDGDADGRRRGGGRNPPRDRRFEGDLLTLRDTGEAADGGGGIALAEAPPRVRLATPLPGPAPRARRVAVRSGADGRVVALIELVSPGNRDGRGKVEAFCEKIELALRGGVHVLLADLFPPNALLPTGMHGAVADRFGGGYLPPGGERLTCAAYRVAGDTRTSFVEPLNVGDLPPTMPLFLTPDRYVNLPLADSYAAAYRPTSRVDPAGAGGRVRRRPTAAPRRSAAPARRRGLRHRAGPSQSHRGLPRPPAPGPPAAPVLCPPGVTPGPPHAPHRDEGPRLPPHHGAPRARPAHRRGPGPDPDRPQTGRPRRPAGG